MILKIVGVAETRTLLCHVYKAIFKVNQGYITLTIKIWSEFCNLYAYAQPILLLCCKFLIIVLKIVGVVEIRTYCAMCTRPHLKVNQGYITLAIKIWSEFCNFYAHAQSIFLLYCKFVIIILKTVGGVANSIMPCVQKSARWVAISVKPDQILHSILLCHLFIFKFSRSRVRLIRCKSEYIRCAYDQNLFLSFKFGEKMRCLMGIQILFHMTLTKAQTSCAPIQVIQQTTNWPYFVPLFFQESRVW